ncbi:MAG: HAD family phosphatase [Deltaproteobacteria bacterium]|nr:HAD family phosphatase [Deltaproteobacteria bacterium]
MSSPSPLQLAALAFDLGNVLIQADHFRFCRPFAALVNLTPEEVYAQVFGSDLEPGYDTGHLSSEEFYLSLMDRFGLALPYPRFCELWNDIFAPLEDMEETVAKLAARYPLYLLSNTNPLHFQYIKESYPLLRHFRRFILSYEVGSRKPESGIFQALIREMDRAPSRCLFLDDKLPFVEAARTHGLVAWHFVSPRDFQRKLTQHGLW